MHVVDVARTGVRSSTSVSSSSPDDTRRMTAIRPTQRAGRPRSSREAVRGRTRVLVCLRSRLDRAGLLFDPCIEGSRALQVDDSRIALRRSPQSLARMAPGRAPDRDPDRDRTYGHESGASRIDPPASRVSPVDRRRRIEAAGAEPLRSGSLLRRARAGCRVRGAHRARPSARLPRRRRGPRRSSRCSPWRAGPGGDQRRAGRRRPWARAARGARSR